MTWQHYSARTAFRVSPDAVVVGKTGQVTLGASVYERLGRPERALLYFDPATVRIGIKPGMGAGSVRISVKRDPPQLDCGGMLALHKIATVRTEYVPGEEGGMLVCGPLAPAVSPPVSQVREMIAGSGVNGRMAQAVAR